VVTPMTIYATGIAGHAKSSTPSRCHPRRRRKIKIDPTASTVKIHVEHILNKLEVSVPLMWVWDESLT